MLLKKLLFSSLLLILLIVLVRCGFPEQFSGIAWNADFSIPLINRFYYVFELEEESSNFFIEDEELYVIYQDEIESDAAASEIKLRPGSSEITPVAAVEDGTLITISIDETGIDTDDIDLIYGIVEQGVIKIEIIDPRPELDELSITFLNIIDEDGIPLQINIDDFATTLYQYNISGHSIGTEDNEDIIDDLEFFVQTDSQEFFFDLVYLRIFFDEPVFFDYFRGYLVNKKINLNDNILNNDVAFPINISNAFSFEEGYLTMTFVNELGFDAQFIGTFTGINNKDDKLYSLEVTKEDEVILNRATDIGVPETTTVVLDKPEVIELINTFPEQMRIENSYMLLGNKDNAPGFAFAADKSSGSFTVTAPAVFTVYNETIIPDKVFSLDITEDNRKYIDKYPESLSLLITMENSIPIGLSMDIYFSESPDTLDIFNPETFVDVHTIKFSNNYVSAAIIDTEPTIVINEFFMEREDIELFLNETIYYATKITFDESDGSITVLPQQHMRVLGKMNVNLNIEIE